MSWRRTSGKIVEGYEDGNADPHWFRPSHEYGSKRTAIVLEWVEWCEQQYFLGSWQIIDGDLHFACELDAMAFKLRWG